MTTDEILERIYPDAYKIIKVYPDKKDIKELIEFITEVVGVGSLDSVKGSRRHSNVQVKMYIAVCFRLFTKYSLSEIASITNVNHATVMYHIKTTYILSETDKRFKSRLYDIIRVAEKMTQKKGVKLNTEFWRYASTVLYNESNLQVHDFKRQIRQLNDKIECIQLISAYV
jgi:predicted DNA-binding protein YlxM (UPF0122 family)